MFVSPDSDEVSNAIVNLYMYLILRIQIYFYLWVARKISIFFLHIYKETHSRLTPSFQPTSLHSLMLDVLSESFTNVRVILHHKVVPVGKCLTGSFRVARYQVYTEVGLIVSMTEQAGIPWVVYRYRGLKVESETTSTHVQRYHRASIFQSNLK